MWVFQSMNMSCLALKSSLLLFISIFVVFSTQKLYVLLYLYQMFHFWATVNGMCFKILFPTVHCQYMAIWLCVCLCVYMTERESKILYFDLMSTTANLFSELSFVFSSVCRFLGICYVANHIVCKCEQLYFFTLTHMSLLSFFWP